MYRDFIPSREPELAEFAQNYDAVLNDFADYGITSTQATTLATLNTAFQTAYTATLNGGTRTPAGIATKDAAKAALVANIRMLTRIIQANPAVTDAMRRTLGITVRKTEPTPIGRPTQRPGFDVVSVTDRTVTAKIHDAQSASKRKKLTGTTGAWVYSFIGTEYPSDPSLWAFQGESTNGKFQATFPSTVPGGTQVWLCCAWVNAKGEAGPISVPVSTTLQGGGAAAVPPGMKLAA